MKHNKTLFFACAAALTLMASCSKEELSPLRFHATIENNDAKCAVDGTQVVWHTTEAIKIFALGNANGETWNATVGDDAQNATFTHQGHSNMEGVETTTYYAVSDVISSGSLNTNGTLNVTINPTVNAINPIAFMASKSTGCDLHFKHFAGMLKFDYSVENIPTSGGNWTLESISIRANGAALSGNFNITFDDNGVPTAVANSGNGNTLTYNTTATTGTVCFPVMPGDYSNFAIVFTIKKNKQSKQTCTKTFNGTLSMEKGQLRVVGGTITADAWN